MPVHFEIHVTDLEKAKAFYATVLGFAYERMPGGMEYYLISSGSVGFDKGLTGGMFQRNAPEPAPGSGPRGAVLTFPVENVDETYALALASGAADAMAPTTFDGVGRCAYVEDGQGNIFGMITPPAGRA
ncbi:MAG: VOC family protein [Hyphomicrobiaceae bacterium]|nr:VOC family protein [Hyphomicrobiaceae bacterium]